MHKSKAPLPSSDSSLYNTAHGMFAGVRFLWDGGENQDPEFKEGGENEQKTEDSNDTTGSDGKGQTEEGKKEEDLEDDDEVIGDKDTDLMKHLKSKVNRTNRQNKNLRDAKKAAESKLAEANKQLAAVTKERDTYKGDLDKERSKVTQERLNSQLRGAGVPEQYLERATKLISDSDYKEEEKEINGKKQKVKTFDVDKFKENNPFLFNSAGSKSSGGSGKKWGSQGGGSGKDSKTTSNPASRFKGPSSLRNKGSE